MNRDRKTAGHEGEMGGKSRTNLSTGQGMHVYIGRGYHHWQAVGKQASRTEGRWTEKVNETEGRKQ